MDVGFDKSHVHSNSGDWLNNNWNVPLWKLVDNRVFSIK